MTSMYIGFNTYIKHHDEISVMPSLIAPVPEEVREGDYLFTQVRKGQETDYSAGKTALDVIDRTSPIEGDEQWVQLLLAAIVQSGTEEVNKLLIGLSITAWDDQENISNQLKDEPWSVKTIEGRSVDMDPRCIEMYPAITAALYDLHLRTVNGELQKKNEELLEGGQFLLFLVGSRHTEWILARGLEIIKGGVLFIGLSTIQLEIREYFYHRTGTTLLPSDVDAALHNEDVEIEGKYIRLDKQIGLGEERLGDSLEKEIERIRVEESVETVFLAGEGLSHVDKNKLAAIIQSGSVVVDQPQLAIIRGLECLELLGKG
jgi:hypothetical protein